MKIVSHRITYHNCPIQKREKARLTEQQSEHCLRNMHTEEGISEAVILQTCNRLEFYLYAKKNFDTAKYIDDLICKINPEAADVWREYNRQNEGHNTVGHLFEVAAGLDSQMVGENQVLSQVKKAYRQSLDCRMSKLIFHKLFHNAFRVGKAVRTETDINCGAVSIGLAAVELAKTRLDLSSSIALIIGAGENAELTARYLIKGGLTNLVIANRNMQTAAEMAGRLKIGKVIGLEAIVNHLSEIDLLISSTASAEPILVYKDVKGVLADRKKTLLMIDIAVPRDIDAEIASFSCVRLYNIDDLNERIAVNTEKRNREIPKARKIVQEAADSFMKWYDSLDIVPVITELTKSGVALAHSEARRYESLFGQHNRGNLKIFAESLVKKVLHGPVSFLKDSNNSEPSSEQIQAAELINKMFLAKDKSCPK